MNFFSFFGSLLSSFSLFWSIPMASAEDSTSLDSTFWYRDHHMNRALQVMHEKMQASGREQEVHILAAIDEARIDFVVQEFLRGDITYTRDGNFSILVPVNKNGNHWCSLALRVNRTGGQNRVENIWFDSLGSRREVVINEDTLNLLSEGRERVTFTSRMQENGIRQNDGYSCGPISALNMLAAAYGLDPRDILPDTCVLNERGQLTNPELLRDFQEVFIDEESQMPASKDDKETRKAENDYIEMELYKIMKFENKQKPLLLSKTVESVQGYLSITEKNEILQSLAGSGEISKAEDWRAYLKEVLFASSPNKEDLVVKFEDKINIMADQLVKTNGIKTHVFTLLFKEVAIDVSKNDLATRGL